MGYSRADWFFWSEVEKDNVMAYQDADTLGWGHTALDKLLYPFMKAIAYTVPDRVAPNVVTIAGIVSLMHAVYLSNKHSDKHPAFTSIVCAALVTAYYVLDAIDGLHAARMRNKSNIGALLVSSMNCFAPALLVVIFCRTVIGIQNLTTIWYAVQGTQFFFLYVHLRETHGESRHFIRYFVPGAAALVPLFPFVCLCRAAVELVSEDSVQHLIELWWSWVDIVVGYVKLLPGGESFGQEALEVAHRGSWRDGFLTLYVMWFIGVLITCVLPPNPQNKKISADEVKNFAQTQARLMICLVYRMVPGLMLNLNISPEVTMDTVLVDGLFVAVLMTDITVSRMAKRALHPWVIIFCMISVLDLFLETLLCVFYFGSIFYDLSEHTKMPLFTIQRNVYVDGVYDLCHIGHMRMFAASAQFGNSLFVGVINDKDAAPYKRKPVMTHEERCTEVGACKYVTKVIPDAPCFGIPREFIEKHNIHLVVCGEEYFTNPNDIYYKTPREMGILQCAPRTQGMSTSELIRRVKSIPDEELVAKDKIRKAEGSQ
ncbi:Choline-phosphate cytidylyltransferase 1 [Diplonema papillatum]|nr:Choline-phosphate cytidylyltransferase 1 [Diplonema papillatum]